MYIHPTAVVETKDIGEGTYIGPFCIVGKNVEIGRGCKLHGHSSLGAPPQYKGEPPYNGGKIVISDGCDIREFVTVNLPTEDVTFVGSNSVLMANVHVAHDAYLGEGSFIVVGAAMAGFTILGKHCYLGLKSTTHQFAEMGDYCVVGANSFFKGKSPGAVVWAGVPARPLKVNHVGLYRHANDVEKDNISQRAWEFIVGENCKKR